MRDLESSEHRELRQDAITTASWLAMATLLGLLMYFLSANGVRLPSAILAGCAPSILLGGYTILLLASLPTNDAAHAR